MVTRAQKNKKSSVTVNSAQPIDLQEKISDLENAINLVSAKLESVILDIHEKDKIISKLKNKNLDLEYHLENLEIELTNLNQYGRRDCIELTNIPESIPQQKLEQYVIEVLKNAEVTVTKRDLVAVHRLGPYKRGLNRTVIVKFINRKDANRAIKCKSNLKKNASMKKIRIRENLCPSRKQIFNKLYKKLMNDEIQDLWTQNGNIYITLHNDRDSILIEHISDVNYYLKEARKSKENDYDEIEVEDEDDVDDEDDDDDDDAEDDDDVDELDTKVVNLRDLTEDLKKWAQKPENLYIGRKNDYLLKGISDFWGNPFIVPPKNKSKKVIKKSLRSYKDYVERSEKHMKRLPELKDLVLGCWCEDKDLCHGKVLIDLYKKQLK